MPVAVDVRKEWSRVLPWIMEIRTKLGTHWRAEDVYAACRYGDAVMFVDPDVEGVLVVRIIEDPHTAEKILFVWIAYCKELPPQEVFASWLEDAARGEGCSAIEFESPRKGFERRGGWNVKHVTYRKELS